MLGTTSGLDLHTEGQGRSSGSGENRREALTSPPPFPQTRRSRTRPRRPFPARRHSHPGPSRARIARMCSVGGRAGLRRRPFSTRARRSRCRPIIALSRPADANSIESAGIQARVWTRLARTLWERRCSSGSASMLSSGGAPSIPCWVGPRGVYKDRACKASKLESPARRCDSARHATRFRPTAERWAKFVERTVDRSRSPLFNSSASAAESIARNPLQISFEVCTRELHLCIRVIIEARASARRCLL